MLLSKICLQYCVHIGLQFQKESRVVLSEVHFSGRVSMNNTAYIYPLKWDEYYNSVDEYMNELTTLQEKQQDMKLGATLENIGWKLNEIGDSVDQIEEKQDETIKILGEVQGELEATQQKVR